MKKHESNQETSQPSLFGSQSTPINSYFDVDIFTSIMALSQIKGVGQKTIQSIYDLGIIPSVWRLEKGDLQNKLQNVGKKQINLPEIIHLEKDKLLQMGGQIVATLERKGVQFITNKSDRFPKHLNNLKDPPRWLFIKGDLDCLSTPGIVAIIGSRDASQEGKTTAYHLAKELVYQNIVVLSGLANGIDFQAHQGAIDYYGQTIGILGHGFDAYYASSNESLWDDIVLKGGAIVTEYLPQESPSRENFLRRNELQAALAKVIIPVEVPDLASGTGATIRRALGLNKPIIGVEIEKRESASLKKTTENLRSLGIPIFALPSQFDGFWAFLKRTMNNHQWDVGPKERQRRFMNKLLADDVFTGNFLDELKKAAFTSQDFDMVADEIKSKLGGVK